jgi:hypothetical protein
VLALVGLGACKGSGSSDEQAPAAEPAAAAPAPAVPPQGLRRSLAPIAVDEARAALPDAGWTALADPVSVNGLQVRATYCVEAATLPAATEAVSAALAAGGWSKLNSHEHPRRPGRFAISGLRTPYRMSGQIFRDRPECAGAGPGQFYTELTIHKIGATPDPGGRRATPAPAPARGPQQAPR